MTMAHRLVHRAGMLGRLATAWGQSGPDFLIIGAQKCGTTSFYNYLLRHPNVAPASKRSIRVSDYEPNWARGPVWYRSHFLFTPGRRPLTGRPLVGESTPAYLYHPLGGERVQKVAPHAQLIVLLRNPVDRAYSHYHHMRRRGREPLGFEEALAREPERLATDRERLLADPGHDPVHLRWHSYLARGHYAEQLLAWLSRMDRSRLHIIVTEDLAEDPAEVMAGTHAFLALPPLRLTDYPRFNTGAYEPLAPQVRERVAAYFAPHNRRLADLLGRHPGWDS
jgi:hypothetical protein